MNRVKNIKLTRIILMFLGIGAGAHSACAQDIALPKFSETYLQQYDFFASHISTHPLLEKKEYAVVSAAYSLSQGKYIPRQGTPKEKDVTFYTKGTRQLQSFKVSGLFSYSHTLQDSVGFSLGRHEEASPYYFFSGAAGNWERSEYTMHGIVSKTLLDERLTVSAMASFVAGNAWRSNDPRMEDFAHHLKGNIGLHYTLTPAHSVGVSGGVSGKAGENSNEYRNKDYQDNLQNMPYINFVNYGYGLNTIQNTNRQMYTDGDGHNLDATYHWSNPKGSLTVTGGMEKMKSKFLRKTSEASSANYAYGTFDEQIKHADIFWQNAGNAQSKWFVHAAVKEHYGKDFNTIVNGNNFVYLSSEAVIKGAYGYLKNGILKAEFGAHAGTSRLYRADGTTDHRADYKNSRVGLRAAWFLAGKNAARNVRIEAAAESSWNNQADVHVPATQENTFSREVVYHDYYYLGANVGTYRLGVLYQFPIKKNLFFLRGDFQYQHAKFPAYSLPAASLPGTNRNVLTLSTGFTL